ncbi:MAG TPA: hypothetical protein VG455_10035, partial [Acidimicrobiales bacterium]|nr:hypothetical protein [Acidimicrobiales bacterium]
VEGPRCPSPSRLARVTGEGYRNAAHVTILFPKGSDGTGRTFLALESMMSETLEGEVITQALEIIDRSLGTLHQRELVSAAEMSDLLLDMRSLLASEGSDLEFEQLEEAGV